MGLPRRILASKGVVLAVVLASLASLSSGSSLPASDRVRHALRLRRAVPSRQQLSLGSLYSTRAMSPTGWKSDGTSRASALQVAPDPTPDLFIAEVLGSRARRQVAYRFARCVVGSRRARFHVDGSR